MDRVSQHVLSGYLPPQWNNSTGESVAARGDLTLIWLSCVSDGQIVLRQLFDFSDYGCICFQNGPIWLQLPTDVFLRATFLLVARDASLWFLRDLTPIGQQGCVPVANVLFWCPDGVGV